mmetsp:Transcript_4931/g.6971  ORF Transcript_4931/g.6971 Transcript_4931/m.6971 type:complete len:217 (+) Transcript_4931:579-1229(+)
MIQVLILMVVVLDFFLKFQQRCIKMLLFFLHFFFIILPKQEESRHTHLPSILFPQAEQLLLRIPHPRHLLFVLLKVVASSFLRIFCMRVFQSLGAVGTLLQFLRKMALITLQLKNLEFEKNNMMLREVFNFKQLCIIPFVSIQSHLLQHLLQISIITQEDLFLNTMHPLVRSNSILQSARLIRRFHQFQQQRALPSQHLLLHNNQNNNNLYRLINH